MLASAALGGCSSAPVPDTLNPVEWYRDVTGSSKNDESGQEANAKNLDSGSRQPYPNLATVPPPPDSALSHVDRDKLAKNLVADRQNAKYTDEQLSAGQNLSALPPPPPMDQSPTSGSGVKTVPLPADTGGPVASPSAQTAAVPVTSSTVAPPAPPKQASRHEMPKKGSEQPPKESPLRPQTARHVPEGDALRPPPTLEPGGAVSAQVAAAGPSAAEIASRGKARGPSVSIQVAEIGFAQGPRRGVILSGDRKQLTEVVKLQRENSGRVRIVGYGGATGSGTTEQQEFTSFGSALDNAKAVAAELAKMGVPANKIGIETAPSTEGSDRADVFVEY